MITSLQFEIQFSAELFSATAKYNVMEKIRQDGY
jgi:hypothetical protein